MATDDNVPASLRLAASLSWRFLVVATAVAVIALIAAALSILVIPASAALLLTTQLEPPVRALKTRGWPKMVAVAAVLGGATVLLLIVGALLVPAVLAQRADFTAGLQGGVDTLGAWLATEPFGLPADLIQRSIDQVGSQVGANAGAIVAGVFTGANSLVTLVFGVLLTLFLVFFFLHDGDVIWAWTMHLFPAQHQPTVSAIGSRAWVALAGYVRGVAMVGLTEACVLGVALWIMGVPVVVPLAVIVFLGAAVPLAGLALAGVLAASIALVTKGAIAAVIVGVIVIIIGQLEGPVIRPLFVGRSMALHPLAVLLTVIAGSVVWGVAGAFLVLPLSMLVVVAAGELYGRQRSDAIADTLT